MEHEDAIRLHAAEGYLLGDLTAAERNAFEDHYAGCDTCFADLRDGRAVIAGVAAYAAEESARRRGGSLLAPFAVAASLAIAFLTVGYEQFMVVNPLRAQLAKERTQVARAQQSDSRPTYELPLLDRRGTPPELNAPVTAETSFALHFVIPQDVKPFRPAIVDAHDKEYTFSYYTVAGRDVDVVVLDGLPAGDYKLELKSADVQRSVYESRFKVR
jgi:hypothetical protein